MRDKKHYTIHLVTVLQFLNACPKYLCHSLINFFCIIVWTQLTEQNGMYAMSWREQRSAAFSASQISCAKSTLPSEFLQGSKSFLNVYQNFKTISRVFSIISWVVASMTSRPCWHQWQFHQQSPPLSLMTTTHAPPMSMLPLWLHLSPFGINGKGCPHTCLWNLWSLLTAPPVNMHDPRTCLYA